MNKLPGKEVRCRGCKKLFGVRLPEKFILELSNKFTLEANLAVMPPGNWLISRCVCGEVVPIQ